MSDQITQNSETPIQSDQPAQPTKNMPNLNELKSSGQKILSQLMQLGMNSKLLLGGALLTFIATFLPAYGFSAPYYTTSFTNFSNLGWLSWLASLVVIVLITLPLFKVTIPMPWPTSLVHLIVSIIGVVAAVIQLLTYLFDSTQWGGPQIGIFLVLLGTSLMTYSAYNEQKIIPQPTQEQNNDTTQQ